MTHNQTVRSVVDGHGVTIEVFASLTHPDDVHLSGAAVGCLDLDWPGYYRQLDVRSRRELVGLIDFLAFGVVSIVFVIFLTSRARERHNYQRRDRYDQCAYQSISHCLHLLVVALSDVRTTRLWISRIPPDRRTDESFGRHSSRSADRA